MNTEESFEKIEFVDSPEQLDMPQQEEAVTQDSVQDSQPQQQEVQQPQVESLPLGEQSTQQETQETQQPYSEEDIQSAVVSYLSEKLGREFNSFEDIQSLTQPQVDERVKAIADFVTETGRDPQEWFAYQQLNPSEMDDLTAIRVQKALQYPNLSQDEVNMLVSREYKVNDDMLSEEDAQYTRLKLKMDAEAARSQVDEYRNRYAAPVRKEQQQEVEPFVNEEWVNNMYREVEAFEGLEFDLGNGNTFTFGVDDSYRSSLKQKNAQIENYFDPYVKKDGSWDYDLLNSHRAVIDNVDNIVSAAYRQGLGDGQKGIVQRAANVSTNTPNDTSMRPASDPIVEQLKDIIGGGNKMTFNF